jgi:hypothetical protein
MADLSPLASANLAGLRALSATMTEGITALTGDMTDPENHDETALTGDEVIKFLGIILSVCDMWAKMAENILVQQPEYQAWAGLQADDLPDLKPGLND